MCRSVGRAWHQHCWGGQRFALLTFLFLPFFFAVYNLMSMLKEIQTCTIKTAYLFSVSMFPSDGGKKELMEHVTVPLRAKYFLQCPMSSHHAEYTWHHPNSLTSCSPTEQQCLVLIDSMGPDQEGTYRCVSSERGYNRTRALYHLQLDRSAAGRASSPLTWVYLMAVVLAQGTSVIVIQ